MHCQSCELITREELGELPGVADVQVSAETGMAELTLDEALNSTADVLKAVEAAGYKAVITNGAASEPADNSAVRAVKSPNKDSDSLKVKLSVQTTAEGRVQEGENGRAYFEGVIKNEKVAEFEIPENRPA